MSKGTNKSFTSNVKPGGNGKVGGLALKALQNFYKRKNILGVEEFEKKHPDKVFGWLNYHRFQQSGFHHENGWLPFISEDQGNIVKDQYNSEGLGATGLGKMVHRNEMVLGYMPREDYEEMKLAEQVVKEMRKSPDSFKSRPGLEGFNATMNRSVTTIDESEL